MTLTTPASGILVPSASRREDLRNLAIIAHVDHGKTTLLDAMLKQTNAPLGGSAAQECIMDSNPQERERGITILAKCTGVSFRGVRLNIVDTPGHADFGSEVERILTLVDGALLLVDAADGPMPQTRYVLGKSLALGLRPIVLLNKMDRPTADPSRALDRTFDLFADLGADESQLDFPFLYASGRDGWAAEEPLGERRDLTPLFELILRHVPGPEAPEGAFALRTAMIEHSPFLGTIAVGRVARGRIGRNDPLALLRPGGATSAARVTRLYGFFGLERREIEAARAGDIVAVAGAEEVRVGDTLAHPDRPEALASPSIDEPTLTMEFRVNDSPFAGREGRFLTSRHLRERLARESKTNVGLRVAESGLNVFQVSGRGELHLSVLIETMRREGYELAVSRPEVILKQEEGRWLEPAELLVADVEPAHQGAVLESLGRRGAEIRALHAGKDGRVRIDAVVTVRGLIGFKPEFLTLTQGTGLMHHSFHGHVPQGAPRRRPVGVLVAKEPGACTGYALESLQERSVLFVDIGTPAYPGLIVGQNSRSGDMVVNPCKQKALTNMRAAGSDDLVLLAPPRRFTLEQAIAYIEDDELVEVTPKSIRLRKKERDHSLRRKAQREAA